MPYSDASRELALSNNPLDCIGKRKLHVIMAVHTDFYFLRKVLAEQLHEIFNLLAIHRAKTVNNVNHVNRAFRELVQRLQSYPAQSPSISPLY